MHKQIAAFAAVLALSCPAWATLTTTTNSASYTGNGSSTAFTVPFKFLANSDLVVTVAGVVKTLGSDFSVKGAGAATGTVTFTVAPGNGLAVVIRRAVPVTQTTSLRQSPAYNAATVENALDKGMMAEQDARIAQAAKDAAQDNLLALGAVGSSSTLVTPTGTTTPRSLGDMAGEQYNVRNFNAKGDGVTNDAAAIQAAVTAACNGNKQVRIPAGTYIVGSTIAACGNIHIHGDGQGLSILQPTITDASPVINFPANAGFFKLSDFAIISTLNTTNFNAGTATAQQCTGIRAQANVSRLEIDNVRVRGVKVGIDITGFIITATNLWAEYNEVGFKGTTMNSADLNLRLENNRQDLVITGSAGVFLRQPLIEGSNTLAVASTIDTSNGVVVFSPYFEASPTAPRPAPFLSVGSTGIVKQLRIVGGRVAGSSGMQTGVYPIAIDNADGVEVNSDFSDGTQTRKVSTTANTKDYRFTGTSDFDWHMDGSRQLGPALNYWPNRQFDLWFRGWSAVTVTRATFSRETTTVRKGANALRVSATAAQNQNHVDIQIGGPLAIALRGKTVRLGAWIFVPNITEYNEAARTALPGIIAESWNGTVTLQSAVKNVNAGRNAWNFFWAEVTMQSDATRFDAIFMPNQSATNATGNEFLIVGTVTLVESTVPLSRQMNDDLPDSPLVPSIGVGGQMVATGTAPPTDVNQTYAVGDWVLNSAPAAAGVPGWVCTTAGSPGTWKAMAALAP